MKLLKILLFVWVAVASAGGAAVALADVPGMDFSRYQLILDRKPFGELTAPLVNAPSGPPPESFAKSLRLSTIIETDDGMMKVGFVDTRNNKSYMLTPGESQDGIELVSASWDDEEAVLRQGGEMALLKLQTGEFQAITAAEQEQRQAQQQQAAASGQARMSYAERRRLRIQQQQEQQRLEAQQKPQMTGDELAKHLYEYQMEVIRQGLPPLPIPLTPEQDAQLVREGVLPPMQ